MSLTWKDAVATVLVGAAGVITLASVQGYEWPLLGSWRTVAAIMLVLGLGTCIIVGSAAVPEKNNWTITATLLGVTAFILVAATIITANKPLAIILLSDIVALWILSTTHHLLTPGG